MNLDKIEDTIFVPMLGRIYATEKFPNILNDQKSISLKGNLPKDIKGKDTQTQYTLLAGAVRSANMDRYIKDFMKRNPNGVIAQLGAGIETTFYRNNNGKTKWYEIDLPEVVEYRKELLGESELDKTITCSALSEDWIKQIRNENPTEPILVTASGLFYYFKKEEVYSLIKILKKYNNIELVFDTVNSQAMKRMSKYMKQVGHEDATMYFYLDDANKLKEELSLNFAEEEAYYKFTEKKGLKLSTKFTMTASDMLMMVKMVNIKI